MKLFEEENHIDDDIFISKPDNTLVNIGLNITGRTSDVTGISSPIVILHSVCCRSRRRKYNESRHERQS